MAEAFNNAVFPFYTVCLNSNYQPVLRQEKMVADALGNKLNSRRAYKILCENFHMDELAYETVFCIAINASAKVVGIFQCGMGSQDKVLVNPSEVFRGTLLCGGSRLILAHNHPSSSIEPSEADTIQTKRLIVGGNYMDITVDDHIIVGRGGAFYSFREHQPALWSPEII